MRITMIMGNILYIICLFCVLAIFIHSFMVKEKEMKMGKKAINQNLPLFIFFVVVGARFLILCFIFFIEIYVLYTKKSTKMIFFLFSSLYSLAMYVTYKCLVFPFFCHIIHEIYIQAKKFCVLF